MLFARHALISLSLAGLIGLAVASWVIIGGRFDVSVAAQLPQPVHDLIHQTRVNAVRREVRSLEAQPANLDDPTVLRSAAKTFQALCSDCHHPPGEQPSMLARSLNPPPADLTEAAGKRSLQELYWVTKHGIRMSAMPAWGRSESDEDLWALASLVARFPDMHSEEFSALLAKQDEP